VTLQSVFGQQHAEDVTDLEQWLRRLDGGPAISQTVVLACRNPVHDGDPAVWFYVEADPAAGVARRRCLACGQADAVLDSEQHWTQPGTWACGECGNSIAELAAGLAADGGTVSWVALGVRCVECGIVAGVTDMLVPDVPIDQVASAL
jgi:hypothetical protein